MTFARIKSCGFVISAKTQKEREEYSPYIDKSGWVKNPLCLAKNGDYAKINDGVLICITDENRLRILRSASAVYKVGKNIKNMYILFHMDENGKWVLQ